LEREQLVYKDDDWETIKGSAWALLSARFGKSEKQNENVLNHAIINPERFFDLYFKKIFF